MASGATLPWSLDIWNKWAGSFRCQLDNCNDDDINNNENNYNDDKKDKANDDNKGSMSISFT